MDGGNLSTDLTIGVLTPASAVRTVEGDSAKQDAKEQARHRSHSEEKNRDDEGLSARVGGEPAHRVDNLA